MTTFTLDLDQPSAVARARAATIGIRDASGAVGALGLAFDPGFIRREMTGGYARLDQHEPAMLALQPHHAERLMQVMRVLLTLKRGRPFDLGSYIDRRPCGTVACACGWAMLDRWFQARVPRSLISRPDIKAVVRARGVYFVASYADLSMWITGSDSLASYLFQAASYPRPCWRSAAAVVERIRLVLNLAGHTGQHTLEF